MNGLQLWRAIAAQLRAELLPATLIYDETPPDAETRGRQYAICDFDPGYVTFPRADARGAEQMRTVVRCCGSTPEQAGTVVALVRGALAVFAPTSALGRVYESDAAPMVEDDSIPTDLRYSVELTFSLDP